MATDPAILKELNSVPRETLEATCMTLVPLLGECMTSMQRIANLLGVAPTEQAICDKIEDLQLKDLD